MSTFNFISVFITFFLFLSGSGDARPTTSTTTASPRPQSKLTVAPEVKATYDLIKTKKFRYAVFHIDEPERRISLRAKAPRKWTFEDFAEALQNDGPEECRYGLYDFSESNSKQPEMILLLWMPDTAPTKQRFMYTSAFKSVKDTFPAVKKYVLVSSPGDLELAEVKKKLKENEYLGGN